MACTFLLASAPPAPRPTRTVTILQVLRRSSLLLAGVLALASRAGGQAVLPSATYVREHWTVADGLPINTITLLVQTRDGYRWLGTNDGVDRTSWSSRLRRLLPRSRLRSTEHRAL